MYKTVDGGASWTPKALPSTYAYSGSVSEGPVIRVDAISCNDALDCTLSGSVASEHVTGTDAVLMSTSNGGDSWSVDETFAESGFSFTGPAAVSCPSGASWCLWTGIHFQSAGTWAVAGYTGTSVAGASVPPEGPSDDFEWQSASCPSASDCYIAGRTTADSRRFGAALTEA